MMAKAEIPTTATDETVDLADLPGSSLPALLLHHAADRPDHVALRKKHRGRWKTYTWRVYAERVSDVANGLRALGVESGDRVAVHSENRPAWLFADLATQALGAVTVGIYPTSPAAEVEYLLSHSEAKVLVAEDEEQLDKVLAVRDRLPALEKVVVVDPRGVRQLGSRALGHSAAADLASRNGLLAGGDSHDGADPGLMTLEELEELGRERGGDVAGSVAALDTGEPALIVYTSGTTGPPKGAMLSHDNLLSAARNSRRAFGVDQQAEVLSYLPLCHIAERLISVINGVANGYVVNFGESAETFSIDLREVQPTFFLGVPRVWEKLLATVTIKMGDAGWLKRKNFALWMSIGSRLARKRMKGRQNPLDRIVYGIGWLLLYRQLREKLGMVRVSYALSGAAPIAPQVLEWFWALGVPVREGYAQTENTAQATVTPDDDVRIGKVGVAVPGSEVRIADDGEILTRGPSTFLGYFKNPEATAKAIDDDGWLHTGDVGELDEDGFLTITDRKKDIIITAGGKNISPSEIENALKVSPYVREAIVIGDRRKFLVALIGIELDTVGDWALQQKLPFTTYADLTTKPEVHELVRRVVDEVNPQFAQVEMVKQFDLLPKELEQEDGEVTATQKVKRNAIEQEFASMIEALYQ
jgi:long-chain acyl-CoA synthetase